MSFQTKIVQKTSGLNVANGTPSCVVAGSDTCDIRVSIYTDSVGGSQLWTETHSNVELGATGGVISLSLNSVTGSWGFTWGADDTIYLQLELDQDGNGDFSSAETFTRKLISTVPFAYYADRAGSINGLTENDLVQLKPGTTQTTGNTTNPIIDINEDGSGTPDLLKLGVGGSGNRLTLSNAGLLTIADDLTINGDALTTGSTTFNLLNTTATTINFGGAATTLNLAGGSGSTGCTINSAGDLTCSGAISGTGAAGFVLGGNSFGALGILGTNDANALAFETNNIERMRLTTTGGLILGATSSISDLHVQTGEYTSGAITMSASSSSTSFTTSSSITLNAGDTVVPIGFESQARTVASTATGTSFSVTQAFSANVSGLQFRIVRRGVTVEGALPVLSLNRVNSGYTTQEWLLRVGGGSAGSRLFDIYSQTTGVTGLAIDQTGQVLVGTTINHGGISNNSRMFIYGGGNGANLDIMGNGSVVDEARVEVQSSDYSTSFASAALDYYGVNGIGTLLGYNKQYMGVLDFRAGTQQAIIKTGGSIPLRFATDDTEVARFEAAGDLTLINDLAVNGGDLTTTQTTFNLVNSTATTINFGGAATTMSIGAAGASGTLDLMGGSGSTGCTVNGTTGAFGCTSSGTFGTSLVASTSSFDLINTTATTVNFAGAATTVNVGIAGASGTLDLMGGAGSTGCTVNGTTGAFGCNSSGTFGTSLIASTSSFDLINTTASTINFGGAATTFNIGASGTSGSLNLMGGSTSTGCTINGITGALTCTSSGTFGTSLVASTTSFDLVNTTATTVNFGGAATTMTIGIAGASGTLDLMGGSASTGCTINGTTGALTCASSGTFGTSLIASTSSFDLINTTATTINFGGAATAMSIGIAGASGSLDLMGGSASNGCTVNGATGNLDCTSAFRAGDGSKTAPSLTFASDADTGLYYSTTNTLGIAIDGVEKCTVNSYMMNCNQLTYRSAFPATVFPVFPNHTYFSGVYDSTENVKIGYNNSFFRGITFNSGATNVFEIDYSITRSPSGGAVAGAVNGLYLNFTDGSPTGASNMNGVRLNSFLKSDSAGMYTTLSGGGTTAYGNRLEWSSVTGTTSYGDYITLSGTNTGNMYGNYASANRSSGSAGSSVYGAYTAALTSGSSTTTSTMYGSYAAALSGGSSTTTTTLYGSYSSAVSSDTSTVGTMYGSYISTVHNSYSTTTNMYGLSINGGDTGPGSITNYTGLSLDNSSTYTGSGTGYGIYIAGAKTYSIFVDAGDSRFDGNILAGTTTNTAFLNVAAATTARASVNIGSGANPTSPNNGDLWWNGTNLNFRTGSSTIDLLSAGVVAADSLDFVDFQDTLDLDAALTVNQSTNTWSQYFTGTNGVAFTLAADQLTSGAALNIYSNTTNAFTGNLVLLSLSSANSGDTGDMIDIYIPSGAAARGINIDNSGSGNSLQVLGTSRFDGNLITNSSSIDIFNSSTLSTMNIGPGGTIAAQLNFLGGNGATGCSLTGNDGWFTCTGTVTSGALTTSGALSSNSVTTGGVTATGIVNTGNGAVDYTPTTLNWGSTGSTILLNALDYSTIGFHDSGLRVDFIRVGAGTIELGYDGGYGNATVNIPGATNIATTSTGTVNIGTGATAQTLRFGTGAGAKNVQIGSNTTSSTTTIYSGDLASNNSMRIEGLTNTNRSAYLCIGSSNGYVNYNSSCTSSSIRFKENVVNLNYGLDEIMALRPVFFNYKPDQNLGNRRNIGFIAEEVNEIIPEVTVFGNDGLVESLDYEKLVSLLTIGVQQLNTEMQALETNINNELNSLRVSIENLTAPDLSTITSQINSQQLSIGNLEARVDNLEAGVISSLVLPGTAEFGELVITGKVNVKGQLLLSNKNIGIATIATGATEKTITFAQGFPNSPVVIAIPTQSSVGYSIQDTTATGFKIVLDAPAASDLQFNWFVSSGE